MPKPAARRCSRGSWTERTSAVLSAYWLFSTSTTTGSRQSAIMFSDSLNAPEFTAPSPVTHSVTAPRPASIWA